MTKQTDNFYSINLPTGGQALLPGDIKLEFPDDPDLTPRQRCATAYIPWDGKYLAHIPPEYQEFFEYVLPSLGNRTTNVHTALSVAQLPFLLQHTEDTEPADARTVFLATILHDTGWSKVSLAGIADSLSYSGVSPTSEASRLPKEQHVLIGAAMAFDFLDKFDFGAQPVPEAMKRHISQIIRRHDYDAAWEKGNFPELSTENKLVCDADRLWSYTHENFWQDTVRKNVAPEAYLITITGAIGTYFITPQGKARARSLAAERQAEVRKLSALPPLPQHPEPHGGLPGTHGSSARQ